MACLKMNCLLPEDDFLDKVRNHKVRKRTNMKGKAYSYNLCHILPTIFESDDWRKKYHYIPYERNSFEITYEELLEKKKSMEMALLKIEKNFGTVELFLIKKLSKYQKDISYVLINDTKKLSLESTRQRKTEKRATELLKSMVGKKNEIIENLIRKNIRLVVNIIRKSETLSKMKTAAVIKNNKTVEMELLDELKKKLKKNIKRIESEGDSQHYEFKEKYTKQNETIANTFEIENTSYKKGLEHFKSLENHKQKLSGPKHIPKRAPNEKGTQKIGFLESFKNPWCPTCKERLPIKSRYIECEECKTVVHPEFTNLPPCCTNSLEISIGTIECTACSQINKQDIMCQPDIDEMDVPSDDAMLVQSDLRVDEDFIQSEVSSQQDSITPENDSSIKEPTVFNKNCIKFKNGLCIQFSESTKCIPPIRTTSIKKNSNPITPKNTTVSDQNTGKSVANPKSTLPDPPVGKSNEPKTTLPDPPAGHNTGLKTTLPDPPSEINIEPPRCYSPNSNDKEFNKISDHFLKLRISLDSPVPQLEENFKNLQSFIREVGFIQENIIDRLVIDRYMVYSADDNTRLQEKRVNTFFYTIDFKDDIIGKLRAKHVELMKKFDALVEELVSKNEVDFKALTTSSFA